MNKAVLRREVQDFIRRSRKEDLSRLILKGSPFEDISVQELATQISGLSKAEYKLPSWYDSREVIYPPNLNLEQTSSEITAKYKASLVSGSKLIDLTGGFGVDSFYFAEKMEKVVHCELNEELSAIAAHNFNALNAENIITFCGNGLDFLKRSEGNFDWIYLDPARRDDYGGKVFLLEQCTPNVPDNLELLFSKTKNILIKTSPLLDITLGIRELEKVAEVHVVSVHNEVKELLWILKQETEDRIKIKTVNFLKEEVQEFGAFAEEQVNEVPLCYPMEFLFEPNPAVMKSGLFAALAKETETCKLHSNSHLFTASRLKDFPGRSFRILKSFPYNKKLLKNQPELKKANVTTRNFPDSVETIRKKLKIKDGGDVYLFFTTTLDDEKVVLVCNKV